MNGRHSRHRRHSSHPGFSHLLTTVLGSPFLTTSDLPELVDGAPVAVSFADTVTRPSSPTPTVDSSTFSFIQFDPEHPATSTPNRPQFRSILPRIWDVLSTPTRTSPGLGYNHGYGSFRHRPKHNYFDENSRYIDYSDLAPLDGEEGELIAIDDEACFFIDSGYGSRAVTGIDILSLLPTELALHILIVLCTNSSCQEDSLWSILSCLGVSRNWRALAGDNTVWRALFLSRWNIDLTRRTRRRNKLLKHSLPSLLPCTPNGMHLVSSSTPTLATPPRTTKSRTGGAVSLIKKRKVKKLLGSNANDPSSPSIPFPSLPSPSRRFFTPPPSPSPSPRKDRDWAPPPIQHPRIASAPGSMDRDSIAASSISTRNKNLVHAPLQINWYGLYRDHLELDRRWAGTAVVSAPPSYPPVPLYPQSPNPFISQPRFSYTTQPPPSPKPRRFVPQVLSIAGHTDSVYCLEFDSRRIVTGSRDRTIRVWSLQDGRLIGCFGASSTGGGGGHTGSVLCLKFSGNWDVGEEEEEEDILGRGRKGSSRGFMVSGSSDCTVCVWSLWTGDRLLGSVGTEERGVDDQSQSPVREVKGELRTVLRGHAGGVLDLRIDDKWIVSCSKDAVIRVWDRHTLVLSRTLRGHEGPVNAVGLQSGRVVSASGDGKMILWDIHSGERLRTFEGHDRGLACIEFKSDLIISGSNDCTIKIWSAETGECIRTLTGHEALVRALAFDPKSGRLVSASYDKTVKVWDLRNGKLVREFKNTHTSHIFDVKFDAARIVSTSHDHKIVVIDFSQGLDTSLFV